LQEFLIAHNHPLAGTFTLEKPEPIPKTFTPATGKPVFSAGEIPLVAGGVRIILKNATIYAEKVIILPNDEKETAGGKL
ncbi:MAG: acetyl-CoA decarbonylase/synthase complex subunit beta, partial [Methanospirillaceae archaeon]|nr:acetyl-CoA decarbonylase/synthase complex subunit beta [Methanospirillaceae archaeon]